MEGSGAGAPRRIMSCVAIRCQVPVSQEERPHSWPSSGRRGYGRSDRGVLLILPARTREG